MNPFLDATDSRFHVADLTKQQESLRSGSTLSSRHREAVFTSLQQEIHGLVNKYFDGGGNCSNVVEFVEKACVALNSEPSLLKLLEGMLPSDYDLQYITARDENCSPSQASRIDLVIISQRNGHSCVRGAAISNCAVVESMHNFTSSAALQQTYTMNEGWEVLFTLDQPFASAAMQLIQYELDSENRLPAYRKRLTSTLKQLINIHEVLPASFMLSGLRRNGLHPISGGGFSDIWKGEWGDKPVCLKVLRIFTTSVVRKKIVKQLCREALVWKQLKHPNVLPFWGVNEDQFAPSFCLVSPWMPEGDIMKFLESHPNHNRLDSICEVANGLSYLHSLKPQVIHGDIRGANVLVREDSTCCLADFGLAIVSETQIWSSSSAAMFGTIRWLAPEIISPSSLGLERSNGSSRDIYAFGCTILEIISGLPPFYHQPVDASVMIDVMNGVRPSRPPPELWCPFPISSAIYKNKETFVLLCDGLWSLAECCWLQQASNRPSAFDVRNRLLHLEDLLCSPSSAVEALASTSTSTEDTPDWKTQIEPPNSPISPTVNAIGVGHHDASCITSESQCDLPRRTDKASDSQPSITSSDTAEQPSIPLQRKPRIQLSIVDEESDYESDEDDYDDAFDSWTTDDDEVQNDTATFVPSRPLASDATAPKTNIARYSQATAPLVAEIHKGLHAAALEAQRRREQGMFDKSVHDSGMKNVEVAWDSCGELIGETAEIQREREMLRENVSRTTREDMGIVRNSSSLLTMLMNPGPENFPPGHPERVKRLAKMKRHQTSGDIGFLSSTLSSISGAHHIDRGHSFGPQAMATIGRAPTLTSRSTISVTHLAMSSKESIATPKIASVDIVAQDHTDIEACREVPENCHVELEGLPVEDIEGNRSNVRGPNRQPRYTTPHNSAIQATHVVNGSNFDAEAHCEGLASSPVWIPNLSSTAPFPVYPYDLPVGASPSTPQTARLAMFEREMSGSLRQKLQWSRQRNDEEMFGPQARRTMNYTKIKQPSHPLPFTRSLVQLTPKKPITHKRDSGEWRVQKEAEQEEFKRDKDSLMRANTWTTNYHTSGW